MPCDLTLGSGSPNPASAKHGTCACTCTSTSHTLDRTSQPNRLSKGSDLHRYMHVPRAESISCLSPEPIHCKCASIVPAVPLCGIVHVPMLLGRCMPNWLHGQRIKSSQTSRFEWCVRYACACDCDCLGCIVLCLFHTRHPCSTNVAAPLLLAPDRPLHVCSLTALPLPCYLVLRFHGPPQPNLSGAVTMRLATGSALIEQMLFYDNAVLETSLRPRNIFQ